MLIPNMVFGTYNEVNKNSNKAIDLIKKQNNIFTIIGNDYFNSKEYDFKFFIDEPGSKKNDEKAVYLFLFIKNVLLNKSKGNVNEDFISNVFNEFLKTAWGVLLLIAGALNQNQKLYDDDKKYKPLINASLKFWPEFIEMGNIFRPYWRNGKGTVWEVNTNLHMVLARSGIPNDVLNKPLPNNDLQALVKQYKLL